MTVLAKRAESNKTVMAGRREGHRILNKAGIDPAPGRAGPTRRIHILGCTGNPTGAWSVSRNGIS
jgi:hypothetical protein